jgi:hypothetical protein
VSGTKFPISLYLQAVKADVYNKASLFIQTNSIMNPGTRSGGNGVDRNGGAQPRSEDYGVRGSSVKNDFCKSSYNEHSL